MLLIGMNFSELESRFASSAHNKMWREEALHSRLRTGMNGEREAGGILGARTDAHLMH